MSILLRTIASPAPRRPRPPAHARGSSIGGDPDAQAGLAEARSRLDRRLDARSLPLALLLLPALACATASATEASLSALSWGESVPAEPERTEIPYLGECEYTEEGRPDTGDRLAILGVELGDDDLLIFVRHGGGCEKHEYAVCSSAGPGSGRAGEPRLHVWHDGRGDRCKALVHTVLRLPRAEIPWVAGLGEVDRETTGIGVVTE